MAVQKTQKHFELTGMSAGTDYVVAVKSLCYFDGIKDESEPTKVKCVLVQY